MPRLQHLSFHVSSYSNIYLIWTALEKASSDLVSLDMDLMGDSPSFFGKIDRSFPAGVKRIGLHLDAFARPSMLFHMLESSAPGLEEIELKSEFANSDIYRRPLLVPKIRHAVTSNYMNGLAKISEATALRLRSLEVWFQKIRDVDLLQIGSLQLEHLLLRNVTTSTISKMGGLPNGIRKLTLLNPDFDARRRRRTAAVIPAEENTDNQHENRDVVETVSPLDLLRSKVVGFGVERIVIESSHWRINQASAQEEIEMWRSLPNVQIIVTR